MFNFLTIAMVFKFLTIVMIKYSIVITNQTNQQLWLCTTITTSYKISGAELQARDDDVMCNTDPGPSPRSFPQKAETYSLDADRDQELLDNLATLAHLISLSTQKRGIID